MLCVGIDVAKRKHDCCIIDSDALKTVESFTLADLQSKCNKDFPLKRKMTHGLLL